MLKRDLMKCLLAGSMLMGLGFAAHAEDFDGPRTAPRPQTARPSSCWPPT